jgi:hypothetical protein
VVLASCDEDKLKKSFFSSINKTLKTWEQFFFLLGANCRLVLLFYQPRNKTIIFIDSANFELEGREFLQSLDRKTGLQNLV